MWTQRHQVAINGIWLHERDPRIIVQKVTDGAGKETISTTGLGGGYGQRVTRVRRDSLDVTVTFGLLIRKTDMRARSELLEYVNGWAAFAREGGWLTVNYKPNRRLRVRLAQAPGPGDLAKWNDSFQILFRAYEVPYWEEETPGASMTTGTATEAGGALSVGGSAATVGECTVENMSGAEVTRVSVTMGERQMVFSSLGMQGGEALVIDHWEDGILRARIRGSGGAYRSVLAKRTGADEFLLNPGSSWASFSATRACKMTATARGRFL